jgi:phosphomannomutase
MSTLDMLSGYTTYLRRLVDLTGIRPLTVVVDAGNGMAGYTVPAVLGDQLLPGLPLRLIPLYLDLDGTFPHHDANPLDPGTLVDLQKTVRETGADIGLAFDGDADRCFVIDENGEPVPPSAIVALIAARELARRPGSTIVYNVITSAAVPEIIAEHGGRAVRERVGHSFMKATMAREHAVFGGEHSGHYYFADFWRADTGMLAALHVLAVLGETDQPLSELTGRYTRYTASGEINTTVADIAGTLDQVQAHFASLPGTSADRLDGLTVQLGADTWFNLRPSNTEPLLRLNVEAPDTAGMVLLRDEVLSLVRG